MKLTGRFRAGFSFIELLMSIAVIVVLVSISMPLLSKLAQSNKRTQAVNLVTAYISNARALAIQMRRPTCVIFYEQTTTNALPANPNQTAIMIGVAAPDLSPDSTTGNLVFEPVSERQPDYMPYGIRVAAIADVSAVNAATFSQSIRQGDNVSASAQTRVIVFDQNGQMLVRNGLAVRTPSGTAGSAARIVADWKLALGPTLPGANFVSTPGLLIYDGREFLDTNKTFPAGAAGDIYRANWVLANSDIIGVNAYTGTILR
jgi:prepilin-type N-terminal cleavage/methylation domain-containing protein